MKHHQFWRMFSLALGLAAGSLRAQPADKPVEILEVEPNLLRAERFYNREMFAMGKDVVLAENEVCRGIVVISGSATVYGTVDGDVVVIGGTATVKGTIHRNLVVILGTVSLAPRALVDQNVVVIGGRIASEAGAKVNGDHIEVPLGISPTAVLWVKEWLKLGLFQARPLPPQLGWVWSLAGITVLLYLLLALVFQRPVQACVQVLEVRPFGALMAGLLALLLLGPFLFLLAISIVGLLVIPFLLCGLWVAFLFGKLAIYQLTGQQLGRQAGLHTLAQPLFGLLFGLVIFFLLYTVPVLGMMAWGLLVPLGLGVGLLAVLGGIKRERPSTPPPPPVEPAAPAFAGSPANPSPAAPPLTAPPPITPSEPASAVYPPLSPPPPTTASLALLPRAGFWLRCWATALDLLLLGAVAAYLDLGRVFFMLWAGYHMLMWTWKGTTLGGIVVGLKLIRLDGRPLNFAVALVRTLACVLSALALFLGFFWAGWDKECQAWHDRIAGTLIVRMPKTMPLI